MAKTDYFEKVANEYEFQSGKGLWRAFKERELAAVRELLPPWRTARVLDLGCGPGLYTEALRRERPHWSFVGVDASRKMVELYQAKGFDGRRQNVEHSLSLEGDFHLVLCLGLLEFVSDPGAVASRISRLLRPGGMALFLVPRINPVSSAYFLYHRCRRNRIFPRRRGTYLRELSRGGLDVTLAIRPTLISEVLVTKARDSHE